MSPRDIVTRAVHAIPGIRLPLARITIERIFRELEENGYTVREKVPADDLPAHAQKK